MKKLSVLLLAGLLATACNEDTLGPSDATDLLETEAILAFDAAGVSDPGQRMVGIHRLPRELQLSATQEAQIKALLQSFEEATRADREALAAISRQAAEAKAAGKTRAEIAQILSQGAPIRLRLAAAEQNLATQIEAVLTPAQKAWLAAHPALRCDRTNTTVLTEAQRNEISALIAAYEQENKADLEAVKAALARAREAAKNGASREELRAILDGVRAASERLHAAQAELAKAIDAVLTPEQRASRCFRIVPLAPRTR